MEVGGEKYLFNKDDDLVIEVEEGSESDNPSSSSSSSSPSSFHKQPPLNPNPNNNNNTIRWDNLSLYLSPPPPLKIPFTSPPPPPPTKYILQNLTGEVKEGEMVGIFGPSGSGKTSLLNALSLRGRAQEGVVRVGGEVVKKANKRVGYVLQQDIFLPSLTVWRTLYDIARLKLPKEMNDDEKKDVVDSVIRAMKLEGVAHTIVGSAFPFVRGISGGELKRLNIASEIITNPSILLVDEPTSGLDSSTAFVVISLLKNLAESGKTIITTIHQPSSRIFQLFDKLILMADGHILYQGESKNAEKYIEQYSRPCPEHYNPADYFLEALVEAVDEDGNPLKLKMIEDIKAKQQQQQQQHHHHHETQKGIDEEDFSTTTPTTTTTNITTTVTYPATWFTQLKVLTVRAAKLKFTRRFSFLPMFQSLCLVLFCSLVWFQRGYTEDYIRDRTGILFFTVLWLFVEPMVSTLIDFSTDRAVHEKERSSGMYRLSAYYFSRIVAENPILFVNASLFVVVVYWVTNLNSNVGRFFAFWGLVLVDTLLGMLFGQMFAALVPATGRASAYALTYYCFTLLVGGYYSLSLPSWIKYLSPTYYVYQLALIIQFDDENEQFYEGSLGLFDDYPVTGKQVLHYLGVNPTYWGECLGIIIFIFIPLLVGYCGLRYLNRPG